jgi:peroxiredoxin
MLAGCASGKAADVAAPAPASRPSAADPELGRLAGKIREVAATEPVELRLDTMLRAVELLGKSHADLGRPILLEAIDVAAQDPASFIYRDRILAQAALLKIEASRTAKLPESGPAEPEAPEPPQEKRPDYDRMLGEKVIGAIRREKSPASRLWGVVSLLPRDDLVPVQRAWALAEAEKQLPRLDNSIASLQVFGRLFDQSAMIDDTPVFPQLALAAARLFAWVKTCGDPACRQIRRTSLPMFYSGAASLVREAGVQPPADTSLEARLLLQDLMSRLNRDFDVTLTALDGSKVRLQELRGKVVLLNFWATWCPPCRREMPALDELYRQSKDRGLVVLAVTDDDVAAVREYAQVNSYSFPIVLDPERRSFEKYRVAGYPSSIVIDREGGIAAVFMGARSRAGFGRALERAGL